MEKGENCTRNWVPSARVRAPAVIFDVSDAGFSIGTLIPSARFGQLSHQ